MMGTQDGVDALLRSIRILTAELGRNDVHVRLLGSGAALGSLKRLSSDLGLEDIVTFAGRVEHAEVLESVATSDVCLCPDPKNPLSDKCSLVKTIEYMSLGKPFVAFDLEEVRRSSGDAALYAESGTDREYAGLIDELLNDEGKRSTMGERGRQRVLEQLTWRHSIPRLHEAYDLAFSHGVTDSQDRDGATSP
jgi:glycosyltransferase involved in cell wall biosynthesis